MERLHPVVLQEESLVADASKARHMAEKAKPYANRAAFGRSVLRAANKAEAARVDRKVSIYEAFAGKSDIVEMLDRVLNAGQLVTAEIVIPPLGNVNDKIRSAYRGRVEAWTQKQEARAAAAEDRAAEEYEANEGYPHRIHGVDRAHKEAKKIKKQIEWNETLTIRYKEKIAKIDTAGNPRKYAGERRRLEGLLAQAIRSADWLKRA